MIKRTTSSIVFFYGLLILAGGVLGYYLQGSSSSLYAGAGFGVLLLLSSILMFCQNRFGFYAAVVFALSLTIVFGIRYFKTGKELTAAFALLSAAIFVFLLVESTRWKK